MLHASSLLHAAVHQSQFNCCVLASFALCAVNFYTNCSNFSETLSIGSFPFQYVLLRNFLYHSKMAVHLILSQLFLMSPIQLFGPLSYPRASKWYCLAQRMCRVQKISFLISDLIPWVCIPSYIHIILYFFFYFRFLSKQTFKKLLMLIINIFLFHLYLWHLLNFAFVVLMK